jgi:hypothetical protein
MNWLSDPGHAWLKVSLDKLIKSGVSHKISSFSYMHQGNAYLEEDCDAYTFLQAIGHNGEGIKKHILIGEAK